MYYAPLQSDFALIHQQTKDIYIKVDLLDKTFKIKESFDGNLISDNLTVNSQSRQRRKYDCELHVSNASFLVGKNSNIWIDKYIRVYYGIKNVRTKEIHYFLLGTFSYQSVDYKYNATTNTLNLSCPDLMADYDGTKNGQVSAYEFRIPAGEDIRTTVVRILTEYEKSENGENEEDEENKKNKFGMQLTRYYVEDIGKEIPYDLEFSGNYTYCDILEKICTLYDSWEFYFDVDGTFIWKKTPTGLTEPVVMDDSFLSKIWIDEQSSYDFTGIYNKTEVWGKVLELEHDDRYANFSTYSDGVYSITLDNITEYDEINHLDQIGIKISANNEEGAKVNINGLGELSIYNDDGSVIKANRMQADQTYVFSYRRNHGLNKENCLYILGQYQCYGVYIENNPDCPFSVENLGYEILNKQTYDQLYSDDLCYNQAEYLTYQSTALLDTVKLELLIVPWLDVNQKIEYVKKQSGESNQYIIKDFSWSSLGGTMSMTIYKFLESFEYVKKK